MYYTTITALPQPSPRRSTARAVPLPTPFASRVPFREQREGFSLWFRLTQGWRRLRFVFSQYLNNSQEHSAISIAETVPQLSQSFKCRCIHDLFGLFLLLNCQIRWIGQQLVQPQPDDVSDKAKLLTAGFSRTALPLNDCRAGNTDTSGKVLLTKPKLSACMADMIAHGHVVLQLHLAAT
jgi:hypothetical protein